MNLRWRFETQLPYARLLAVVSEDGDGFSAEIEGKIVASPRTEDARVRDQKITDQYYGLNPCAHIPWKHCGAPLTKKSKTTSDQLTSGLLTRVSRALIAR